MVGTEQLSCRGGELGNLGTYFVSTAYAACCILAVMERLSMLEAVIILGKPLLKSKERLISMRQFVLWQINGVDKGTPVWFCSNLLLECHFGQRFSFMLEYRLPS